MLYNVNDEVRGIIRKTISNLKKNKNDKLTPEDILMTIIDEDNLAHTTIKDYGVDTLSLYDSIVEKVYNDITPYIRNENVKEVIPSSETKLILELAEKEAKLMNHTMIASPHIILAILKSNINLSKILNKFKMEYNEYKDSIVGYYGGDISGFEGETEKPKRPTGNKSSSTPALDSFCTNISKKAKSGGIDPVIGRDKEIKRVCQILSRRKKRNPILIGDPGVGKTSIIEGIGLLISEDKAPNVLMDKRIYSLDLSSVIAGTKFRGQFEERMKTILDELIKNDDIILFIDEIHTIVGAGNSAGGLDVSNIIKPALARGEIQVIGATTLDEYRENIEKDGALTRRFQEVLIEEPTLDEVGTIINNIKNKYEDYHNVSYTNEALEQAIKLSDRYITERAMPDKVIDVIDEAGAGSRVFDVPEHIEKLEKELKEFDDKKKDFVKTQNYEEAASIRDKEKRVVDELQKAKEEWKSEMKLNKIIIDEDIICNVVSEMSGVPVTKLNSEENKALINMEKNLNKGVIGQSEAINKITKAIKRGRLGVKDTNRPSTFMFLGNSGVGKTHLTKKIAEEIFGDQDAMVRLDMSEYMEKFTTSRLIGSPPGYVGHEEGGQLTEKVRKKPYCVILLDEIEKAHESVFNILLQVLEDGVLTDGLGRKVNFKNTLIIMTSNVGVRKVMEFGNGIGFKTNDTSTSSNSNTIMFKALKQKFNPEFLNRLDDIIIFNNLSNDDINKIVKLELNKLKDRMSESGYNIKFNDSITKFIGETAYDVQYGVRPLKRAIQDNIEDEICEAILNGYIKVDNNVTISYSKTNKKVVIK